MNRFEKPSRGIFAVFLHCSGSDRPEHDDVSVVRAWHIARGLSDVGYHWFVRRDGEIQPGRPLDQSPEAQKGHDAGTIAICLHGLRKERFTEDQFDSLRDLCASIDECYRGGLAYRGYCEVSEIASPVFDYRGVLDLERDGRLSRPRPDGYVANGERIREPDSLRIFDRSEGVCALQCALNRSGCFLSEDGLFGIATRDAVIGFQLHHNLFADGIVGRKTWGRLTEIGARAEIRAFGA